MRLVEGRGQVWPFGMPEVFLGVLGEDGAVVGDESCHVQEGGAVLFDDGSRDDADIKFSSERAIGIEVGLVL
jgi:hypothetical protein